MNILIPIIIIAFIILVYIYTFLKQRKKRMENQRNLDSFRLQYQHRLTKNSKTTPNANMSDYHYISNHKYQEDYRERKPDNPKSIDQKPIDQKPIKISKE